MPDSTSTFQAIVEILVLGPRPFFGMFSPVLQPKFYAPCYSFDNNY